MLASVATRKRQPIDDMIDANLWIRWQERPERAQRKAESPLKAKPKARRSAPP
jgi:hypothetical protein